MTTKTKGKKKGPTDLAVAMVLDKSGSMYGLAPAVIDGFNEYVSELRKQEGETIFSLSLFDTSIEQPYIGVPLDTVEALTSDSYQPGGNTALYDAIAWTVVDLEKRLKQKRRSQTNVLIVTMTDGAENSSTDYTADRLADLVREYEERGNYTFVYIGLGQTREYVGQMRGMGYTGDSGYFPAASGQSVRSTMSSAAVATAGLRASGEGVSADFMGDVGIDPNADANQPNPVAKQPKHEEKKRSESSLSDFLGGKR